MALQVILFNFADTKSKFYLWTIIRRKTKNVSVRIRLCELISTETL
ncbi:hypothetical protein HMPREF9136_0460 [Prevotella dentalis DSM 3688]|uniref:Uncharacterized protein n=1 Tax=Prevotella dentalis (strain ATCC 49559 / DSM 3688 / JCM 13448 / NCTC 12043 / ES 2772) TaxID=908937 RepID=F9D0T2_PREDD|nr:hypothetical protein HMPREF9136_0460 [Prevotella dentalis DSM 3688]